MSRSINSGLLISKVSPKFCVGSPAWAKPQAKEARAEGER